LIPLVLVAMLLAVGGGVWIAVGGPGEPPEPVKVKSVIPVAQPEPQPAQPEPQPEQGLVEAETAAKLAGGRAALREGDCTLLVVCSKPAGAVGAWNTRIYTDGTYLYHDFILPGETVAYQPTASGGWVVTAPAGDGITVAVIPVDGVAGAGAIEFVPGWDSVWWQHNVKSLQVFAVEPPVCRDQARARGQGVVPATFIEAIYQSRPAAKPTGSGQSVELI
jgi:hypothetical protein